MAAPIDDRRRIAERMQEVARDLLAATNDTPSRDEMQKLQLEFDELKQEKENVETSLRQKLQEAQEKAAADLKMEKDVHFGMIDALVEKAAAFARGAVDQDKRELQAEKEQWLADNQSELQDLEREVAKFFIFLRNSLKEKLAARPEKVAKKTDSSEKLEVARLTADLETLKGKLKAKVKALAKTQEQYKSMSRKHDDLLKASNAKSTEEQQSYNHLSARHEQLSRKSNEEQEKYHDLKEKYDVLSTKYQELLQASDKKATEHDTLVDRHNNLIVERDSISEKYENVQSLLRNITRDF